MDKAPDAFRTISEVADDLDIPQHVLRFWETRFAQIKPKVLLADDAYAFIFNQQGLMASLSIEGTKISRIKR